MPHSLKPNKGLLKRVKITASGKVKFRKANTGHLKSHKRGKKLMQLRCPSLAKAADIPRLSKMLHRTLTAAK